MAAKAAVDSINRRKWALNASKEEIGINRRQLMPDHYDDIRSESLRHSRQ